MFGRSGTAAPPKLSGIGDHANGGHGSGPNSGHGSGNGQHAGSGNGGSGRHHATNGGDDGGAGGGDGKQLVPAAGSPQHRATLLTSLASFVPQTIRRFLQQNAHLDDAAFKAPMRQDIQTVALFADVSGFTELSESLASKGPIGSEELGYYLNKHFELMGSIIGKSGGDVFKFAGDAMLVLWPPSSVSGAEVVQMAIRATECCLEIQKQLGKFSVGDDVRLMVKLGVGVGLATVLHVGGVYKRLEYLACGPPLVQAFHAEAAAQAGDTVLSKETFELVRNHFHGTVPDRNGFVKVLGPKPCDEKYDQDILRREPEKFDVARLKRYLPAAVLPRLEIEEKLWTGELRQVTVVFLNLGLDGRKLAKINKGMVDEIQGIISSVQNAVYEYEGSLNKFLVDDKGALIVLVFGLPPVAHENDPARAVLSCLRIRQLLARLQPSMAVSFGITSGLALCGLVGSGLRREYSVLGDVVNLSARLMQHVQKEKIPGGILVDKGTAKSADAPLNRLKFEALQSIHVKGKSEVIPVFVPLYMPAAASFTMLLSNPKFHKAPIGREKVVSFLSQRATSFAHDGVSHIVVLDGEVGVGKSHVLRHLSHVFRPIVNATTAEPHLNAATAAAAAKLQFVWGVGDPFLTSKPHSVWRQVFDTILPVMNPATRHHTHMHSSRKPAKDDESGDGEEEKKDGLRGSGGAGHINVFVGRAERQGSHAVHTNPSHVDSQSTRRDWILKFAASKNFPPQPRVFAFFNDMLGTNFEETAEEKTRRSQHYNHGGAAAALAATQAAAAAAAAAAGAMTPSELRAAAGELLVLLLQEYAASQKVIVALDECQSMSEPDWNATFEVCKAIKAARIKNFTLWMACRPLRNKRYAPRFSAIPTEYYHILDMAQVVTLDFWQPKHTLEVISRLFRARSSDPELVSLIHERTGGHPLFCTKFASALKSVSTVIVDPSDSYVRFSDKALATADWDLELPVPYHIQRVVASHVDILSPSQIFLMKVASVMCVGKGPDAVTFRLDMLKVIHPVPLYWSTIETDAAIVEELGFLTRVKSEFKKQADDEKFENVVSPPYSVNARRSSAFANDGRAIRSALNSLASPVFAFKNGLLRDVIYGMMFYSQRRALHLHLIRLVAVKLGKKLRANREFAETIAAAKAQQAIATAAAEKAAAVSAAAAAAAAAAAGNNSARKNSGDGGTPVIGHGTLLTVNTATATTGAGAAQIVNAPTSAGSPAAASGHNFHLAVGGSPYAFYQKSARSPGGGVVSMDPQALAAAADLFDIDPDLVKEIENELKAEGFDEALLLLEEADLEAAATAVNGGLSDGLNATVLLELEADAEEEETENLHGILQSLKRHRRLAKIGERPDDDDDEQHNQKQNGRSRHSSQSRQYSRNAVKPSTLLRPVNEGGNSGDKNSSNGITGASTGNGIDRSMNTNPSPNKPGATGTKGGVTGTPAKLFVTQKTTRGNRPLPRSNSRGVDQLEADTLSGRGGNGANASAPSVRRKGSTDAEGGADGQTGSDNSDEHTCCLCCMGLCLSADEPIVKYQQQPSGTNGRRQISATHSHNMAVAAAAAHRKEGGTTGANVGGFSAIPNPNTTNAAGGGRHHHLQPNQPPNASPNRPGGGAGEGTLRSSTATGNGTTVTAANIKLSSFNDSNGEHKTGSHHTNSGTDSPGGGDVKASLLPHKNMSGSGHQHLTPTTNVLIVNDSTASGSGSAGGGLGGGVHGSGGAIVLNGARASSSVSVAVHQHRSGIPFAPRKSSIRSAEAAALLVTSVAGNNNPTNANHLHNISLRQPNPMIDPSHSPGGGGGRATDVEVLASLIADGHAHVAFDEKGRKMGGDPFGLGTGNFGASNLRRPPRLTQSDMDVMRAIVGRKASTAVITPPAAVPSHPPVLHPSQSMPLVSPHTPATSPPAAAGGPAAVPVAMIRSASTTTPSTAAGIAALTSPSAAGAATNNAVSPGATMTPAPTPAHNNKQPPIQSPSPSAAALLDPKARAISEAMRRVGDWEFDIFALSDASTMHPLVYIGYAVFHHFELPKAFRIPERTLFNFLSGMEFGYNWQQNPFHSSVHIADVLHTVYVLMRKMSFTLTNELDLLSLCVAAIVHDYRHPGFTNQFFVASMENRPKDVSLTDPRVLENFHCTGAFKFLREEKNNIFVNMSAVERREVRQKIVQLVLATSMDRQSEFLAEVERDAVVHKGYIPGGVLPLSPLAPSTAPALSGGGASPGVSGMISPGGLMVLPEASPSPAAPVVSSASAFSTPIKPPQFGDAKDKPSPTSLPAAGAGAGAEPEEKSIYETAMAILAAKKAAAAETGGDATVVTGAAALTRSKRSGRKSARDSAPPAVATANVTPTKPFAAPAPVTPAGPPPGLLSAGSTKRSTTSTAQLMKSISSDANPAAAPAPEAPLSTTHANSSHSGGARDSVVPDSKLEDRSPSHSPPSVHSNLPSEFRAVGEGGDSDNEGIAKPGEGTMTEPATATVDGVATAVVILPPSGQSSPKNNFRSIASEDETSESTHHLRPGGLNPNSSQNEDSFGGLQRTVSMDTSMVRHSKELKTLLNSRRQKSQDDDTMGTVAIAAASGLPPPRTSLTAAAASDSTTSGSAPPLSSGVGMLPLDEDKQLTPGRDVISPGMNTRSIRDAVQPARGEAGAPPRHSFGTSHRLPAPITIPNENTLMRTSAYQPPSPNSAPVFGGGVAGPNTASILLARGDSTNSAAADATPSSVGPLHVPGLNGFGTDSTLGNGPPRGSVSHLAQRRGSERSAAQAAADAAASLAAANALMGGKGSGVAGSNRHATNLKRRTMERLIQEGVQAQQKKKAQPSITIMPRKSVDGGQPGSATGNGPSHAHHTHHGSESKTFAGVVGANQTPTAAMMLNMSGPHHPHAHRVPRDSMAVKKKLLLKLVLKCADVSAAAKPFHLYKPWAHAQHTELLKQGDIERSRIAMATVAAAAANGGASSSWVAVNSVPSTLVGAATATTAAAGSSPNSTATNSNKLVLSKYMDRQHPQVSELRTELHLHTITHLVRPLFDTLGRVLSAAGPSSDGAELAARTKAHLSENVALLQQRALEIRKNSDLTGAAFGASNTVTVAAPGSGPGNKSTPAKMTLNSTQPLSPTPSPQRVTSGTPPK